MMDAFRISAAKRNCKAIAKSFVIPGSLADQQCKVQCKCCQVTLKVPALVPRIGRPGPFRVGVQAKQQWLKSPVICWVPNMANSDRGTGVAIWLRKRKCNLMSNSYFAWCQTMPGLKEMMQKYVQKSVNAKWHETDSGKVLVKFLCNLCITIDRADHVYLTLTLFLEAHQGFGPVAVGAACCRSSIVVLARSLDAAVTCSAMQCHAVPCSAVQCRAVPCSAVECCAVPCLLQVWQFILHGNCVKNGIDARKVARNDRSFSDSMARQNMQARTMSTWSRFSSSNCPTFRRQVGQMSVKR